MPDTLWLAAAWALPGLMIGSFLNVLIHRWPLMLAADHGEAESAALSHRDAPLSLSHPGSHCPHCGSRLTLTELIPVLSFLWQRGRCRHCHLPIALRYPAVELLTMGWWVWCGLTVTPLWGPPLAWAVWGSTLLALAWIDWDSTWLPDGLTQPLAWAGLVAAALGWNNLPLQQALAGAVLGYLSLWSVATVFHWVTGQEGMGGGDFKLLAALGAWLGPWLLIPLVLLASMGGLAIGLLLRSQGKLREGLYVPFGPFLVVAGMALRLGLDRVVLSFWGLA